MALWLPCEEFSTAQNGLGGAMQDRRGVYSAAALEFYAGTAGALGVSGRLFGRGGRGRGGGSRFTKRIKAGFAVALGELVFGEGH